MYSLPVCLVALFVIFISPTYGQVESTTKFRLMVTKAFTRRSCTTKNNEEGICAPKSTCNNEHEIEVGGRISDSELRAGGGCNLQLGEWCCSFKNKTTTEAPTATNTQTEIARGASTSQPDISRGGPNTLPPDTPTDTQTKVHNCLASDQNDCPWFVKLYRSGQDYPYCLGAMIGSNTILTTATCELQAKNQFLWARVPSSANPEANYTIISRLPHPQYNSGSRYNDLALLSTLTNINWGSGGAKGACIDPDLTLGGECAAANINEYDDLDMVSLFVTQGSCSAGGNVPDAMCGTGLILNYLADGAPIMCQKNNFYVLSGITKTAYPGDTAKGLLGNLDYAWLTDNLKTIAGLKETDYLFKLNYN